MYELYMDSSLVHYVSVLLIHIHAGFPDDIHCEQSKRSIFGKWLSSVLQTVRTFGQQTFRWHALDVWATHHLRIRGWPWLPWHCGARRHLPMHRVALCRRLSCAV